ncbi:cytochrome P450 [Loktanella sp. IMCC34160]|uniref:cytochrome P450 n=1 Tax=Loktanella sp. IMCC34160 TaxID=2510646 RepID=UPI00101CEB7B|nr:cytochrome P450 [Loktanella sp. IMCC34160]RYG89489.1 cytochrome P450 [Loktanella sp. IMCC34160]
MSDLPPSFDPLSPAFAQDPYPAYADLRAQPGPVRFDDFDIWLVSRFEDVNRVVQDKTMVRASDAFMSDEDRAAQQRAENFHDMPNHERFVQFSLLDSDGPVHDRLRKLVFREFTKTHLAGQRGMIETFVAGLVDEVADKGTIDFIGDFAAHIPGHVIGRVIGVPDEDCPQLRQWSEDTVSYFDIDRTDAKKAKAEQAVTDFYHYLLDLMKLRRTEPDDGILTSLIGALDRGDLSEDELISTCMLILMAGHGSTIDVLGSGMHALLRHPDQMRRLRDDRGLMPTAIQEMFRYESPLPFFHRYATEDCEVAGKTFHRGDRIGVLYGAANRDPAAFDLPETFDVGRNPNRHLAFGGGAHFCLGNQLARIDMEVVFGQLFDRFSRIELAEEAPIYKTGLSVRGPKALKVTFTT